jgi:hypothetical protein
MSTIAPQQTGGVTVRSPVLATFLQKTQRNGYIIKTMEETKYSVSFA